MAVTYAQEGDYARSESIFARLVLMEQSVLGEENIQTLRAMGNLAEAHYLLHKYVLAEQLFVKI